MAQKLDRYRLRWQAAEDWKNLHEFFLKAPTEWVRSLRNRPDPETGKTELHNAAIGDRGTLHMYVGQGVDVNALDILERLRFTILRPRDI
jgi:hypothetical protein